MPIRSSGCLTCRRRKIRCDEARPGCRRCATHGVACGGYRAEDGAAGSERGLFKDETLSVVRRARKEYGMPLEGGEDGGGCGGGGFGVMIATALGGETEDGTEAGSMGVELVMRVRTGADTATEEKARPKQTDHVLELPPRPFPLPQPWKFRSPALERQSLYDRFIDIYLPRVGDEGKPDYATFMRLLVSQRPETPVLQRGMDALSLVQIGSIYKDKRLLQQSVAEYGRALNALARIVARGDFLVDDDTLVAVTVLSTCELYEEIAKAGGGWSKHVEGAAQLMAARGPESMQSEMALLLYSNMRHKAFMHGLIARKASFIATPEWRAVALRLPEDLQDESALFYDLAIRVPGLLERFDELDAASTTALADLDELFADTAEIEEQLRTWFQQWREVRTFFLGPIGILKPVDEFPIFASVCRDRMLEEAYGFPDFITGYIHSLQWMSMYYLRVTMQSLREHRRALVPEWIPTSEETIQEQEILQYVLDLCRCIPFFCESTSGSIGSVGIFLPMRIAARYFVEHGHWRWLKWLNAMRYNVFVMGLSPPNVDGSSRPNYSPPKQP